MVLHLGWGSCSRCGSYPHELPFPRTSVIKYPLITLDTPLALSLPLCYPTAPDPRFSVLPTKLRCLSITPTTSKQKVNPALAHCLLLLELNKEIALGSPLECGMMQKKCNVSKSKCEGPKEQRWDAGSSASCRPLECGCGKSH